VTVKTLRRLEEKRESGAQPYVRQSLRYELRRPSRSVEAGKGKRERVTRIGGGASSILRAKGELADFHREIKSFFRPSRIHRGIRTRSEAETPSLVYLENWYER